LRKLALFQILNDVSEEEFSKREIVHLDLAYDPIPEKHYKADEVNCAALVACDSIGLTAVACWVQR